MIGVSNESFAPLSPVMRSMVVTVLSRLSGMDLTWYTGKEYPGIEGGTWYSDAAAWAKDMGIVINDDFAGGSVCRRSHLALMLVRYLNEMNIPYSLSDEKVNIADADNMTAEEKLAFEILIKLYIFKGKGDDIMDPAGETTRAELAALLHRLSDLINWLERENQKI